MLDTSYLIEHWGYPAIFGIVVLGNLGLPLPEEGVLILAGYLAWARKLRLVSVLAVGVSGAIVGDNLGYWFGRHYGQTAIQHYGHKILITPARLDKARAFVARCGSYGVFIARFLPGLRFMAGPLAGSAGLPFPRFFTANLLGGLAYVPLSVGVGYALGHSFRDALKEIERLLGRVEHLALIILAIAAVAIIARRAFGLRQASRRSCES